MIFMAFAILSWRWPRWGLLLVVLLIPAYVVKLAVGPIPTTAAEMMLWGALVGWLVRRPAANFKNLIGAYRPIWLPLALLLIGAAIGITVSADLRLGAGILKGWFIDPILLYGLIVAVCKRGDKDLIVPALALSALPLSIVALWQVATGHFITIDGRASAWFVSANYLTLYLVPILLLSFHLLLNSKSKRLRPFFWISWSLGAAAVYFSFSYGGWLALLSGLIALGIWQFRRNWKFWTAGGILTVLAAATQLTSDRVARMLDFKTQSSASVRLQVWATDWLMAKTHWLAGIGLGEYPARYPQFVTKLFASPLEPAMLHAHNLYFQFLLNLGAAGLIGFGWLLVKFFQWIKSCPASWAAPLTAAMVAILIHGLVDTPYWKNDLSMIFWLLLALAANHSQTKLNSTL